MPHLDSASAPAAPGLPYRQHMGAASGVELEPWLEALAPAVAYYASSPPPEARAIFSLAGMEDDLPGILALAEGWREKYRTLVVIGAGGSGLSGKALAMLETGLHSAQGGQMLRVLDNLDLLSASRLLGGTDLAEMCFLIVSKSGSTVETCAQTYLVLQALQAAGLNDAPERMVAITMAGERPLRACAEAHGIPVLDHDSNLGGRFSVLSAVGLIPAVFMGVDARRLRAGAAAALNANLKGTHTPAAFGAALQAAMLKTGRNINVFMPYSGQLYGLALWWRQSWAESLGKNGEGMTPFAALGPADQHSQLQMFLDGPDDKFFTLLLTDCYGKGARLPDIEGALSYLSRHTLGDMLAAQQRATAQTLERHRRPLRIIGVETVDAYTFGALVMHFTLEILFIASLLHMNPFDQPAVEESKHLARALLKE